MQNLYESVSRLDGRCYDSFLLSEDILMEHAAAGISRYIRSLRPEGGSVLIVAGPGNNGGDGVAAARQLLGDFEVRLVLPYGAKSPMCKIQLERFLALGGKVEEDLSECHVVVDALFGSGLSKPLKGDALAVIERLNSIKGYKIAVDIPSGLDIKGNPAPTAFEADVTLTMGAPKISLYMDAARDYVGDVEVVDLGISRALYETDSDIKLLEAGDLKPPYRRKISVNKGDFGHLAVIAGEKSGAALIAAQAAMRFGVGLVSILSNEKIEVPSEIMFANSVPENCSAIAVGMGLGNEYSDAEFEELVLGNDLPIVADADLLSSEKIKEVLKRKRVVVTPHPKEYSRLLERLSLAKAKTQDIQRDRIGYAKLFCEAYPDAVLILKGASPLIAKGEKIFVNPLGSNALAKGGSGDVLSGMVGALLAQGFDPLTAALQASLAHAVASARYSGSNYSMTPQDLIKEVAYL